MDNMHGYDPQAKRDCSSDSLTAHFSSATMTIDNQSPAAAATATQRNDVLYPFTPINSNSDNNNNHHRQSSGNNNNNDTVLQADVLQSYISHHDENAELEEPELQRQYTARLDDLLADGEKQATAAIGRRYSLYAANIQDPSRKIPSGADRYVFYSADLGSAKSDSLRDLLVKHVVAVQPGQEKSRTVADLVQHTSNWWVDILAPSDAEMRAISKIFRIHPLTTEDIQAQESREKCEIFSHYMFISFRSFNNDVNSPDYLEAINFYIIVFKTGVLTFHFQPVPHPDNVRKRIHQLKDFIHVTPEWINYALIDDITDSFAPLIQHTELEVDSIDDLVLVLSGSEQTDMLRRIGSCRKTVMQLLRLLGPKADVVRSLIKRYTDKSPQQQQQQQTENESREVRRVQHEVTLYLGDIQDHILTMLQNVNHYDLVLGRAHRNYLGQISIELSQAGNTANEMINRLTYFATVVVPPNIVAGLFGMNVHVPGEESQDLTWFFWIVLSIFLYTVAMIAYGKRAGFL